MGEKETARESPSKSSLGRSSVQDFEKNSEAGLADGGDIDTGSEARVRGGNVSADRSEHVYQHNQSDLEFREAGGGTSPDAGDEAAQRKDISITIKNQKE